jgi:hypothetical protein
MPSGKPEQEKRLVMTFIGHVWGCAIVVGKPCDCGGVWRKYDPKIDGPRDAR